MTPIFNNTRLIPRDSDFLDRKLGSKGEIFYDRDANSLRLFDGIVSGGYKLARTDLVNVSNATFYSKAQAAGVGAAGITSFSNIAVLGQVTLEAESSSDTLNIVAGTGITITTNVSTDTLTINADSYTLPVATTNSIGGVKVDGTTITITDGVISSQGSQSVSLQEFTFNVAADDSTQREITNGNTVKFIGAGSVTTSTNADGNVTITGAVATGFSSLSDVSPTGLTVDKVYLPAMTMLNVTNNSVTAYRFDQYGSSNNPTIYVISGTTVAFNLQATGLPFLLQDNTLTNISAGLIHVSTAGVVSTGSNAQGKDSGTLYWKIPASLGGVNYAYQCGNQAPMVGTITIKGIASI